MGTHGTGLRARKWQRGALQALTVVAVAACCSAPAANAANAPGRAARAVVAQRTREDPCRYATAQDISRAFGRPMKSSALANACEYRDAESRRVIVKVEAGPEGTILRYARGASAQGHKGAEKVATTAGEAYFESVLPAFIGRVGNHEVQVETTVEPVPRDAMVAVGLRIMETLARK